MKNFIQNLWEKSTALDWFVVGIVAGSFVVGFLMIRGSTEV